jgi:hypothetical protein
MISVEGMNLNVNDWHGRPPLLAWGIVRHLGRIAQSAAGKANVGGIP